MADPVGRRQAHNYNLGTRDFLVVGPVRKRQGKNCNLGTRDFLGGRPSWKTGLQLQSRKSRFCGGRPSWKATGQQLQRFFGGRPSWKAKELLLQSGNSWFLSRWLVVRRQGYNDKHRGWSLSTLSSQIFRQQTQLPLQSGNSRFFGGRPSWRLQRGWCLFLFLF